MPYDAAEKTTTIKVEAVVALTVLVRKLGNPVEGANVIVISKAVPTLLKPIPDFYTAKTTTGGKAFFSIPDGTYLVLADDGTDWRAFKDEVPVSAAKPAVLTLDLVERREVEYYVKLYLSVSAAEWVAPIINALAVFTDKFLELAGLILDPLGIKIPAVELAKHVEITGVEGKGNEVTIWLKYVGSPVPQAVVTAVALLAVVSLLVIVTVLVLKWAFGEKLPAVVMGVAEAVKWVAIASLASSVVSLGIAAIGTVRKG
jgi:hypothetical protein